MQTIYFLDMAIRGVPLTPITAEQDLAYLKRNEEKIVSQIGREQYDKRVKQLQDWIASKANKS